ncbi:MAG: ChaN family lipoprotein [Nitrospiraceae bacterium]|nr:MAG: ChaN family lipoprotein [Nitrospiraceae bacterium]
MIDNILKRILFLSFILFPAITLADTFLPAHNLSVHFDLGKGKISGISEITLPVGQRTMVAMAGLTVRSVSVRGKLVSIESAIDEFNYEQKNADDVLTIVYEAVFEGLPEADTETNPGVVMGNLISPSGISLTGGWHPTFAGLAHYRLTAILPKGFVGISEANEIVKIKQTDGSRLFTFLFPHPLEGISLVAGTFIVEQTRFDDVDIYTYFHPEDAELAETYRTYARKYIDMYQNMIGAYPFRRFSIVENILPTGYAMPTFTLLGKDVVKLPFIVDTSLGHEILHQWFGNSVYVDYESGNWSEGLTTYLADHTYKEREGLGWKYRKELLTSFQNYVTEKNDFPLSDFSYRKNRASGSIGYGKTAMVFHMLKNLIGEEQFIQALKSFINRNQFRVASWDDLKNAFETESGKELDWFFTQWIERPGIPEVVLEDISVSFRGSRKVISARVLQKGPVYRLEIPVTILLEDSEITNTYTIDDELLTLNIEIDNDPVALIVDYHYDLFRTLTEEELPPVISGLLGDSNRLFVLPEGKDEEYVSAGALFEEMGFTRAAERTLSYEYIKNASLIIPGKDTKLTQQLFGKVVIPDNDFWFSVKRNPYNPQKEIALMAGSSPSDIYAYARKIAHYGKYSTIIFDNGRNVKKQITDSSRGMGEGLTLDVLGIHMPKMLDFQNIIDRISDKQIIYIGESHDRFEHHRVQFEVIRALHENNIKIAIGMEMFQKPFQSVLDDYISGTIDEKEFLKKSEYFERWRFDYNLYRDILHYAKAHTIPIIALNLDRDIVATVSQRGIQDLSDEERGKLPEHIDLSNDVYKKRLQEFFEQHGQSARRNFDFFYQAQVIWDETMALNLDAYIREHPEYSVVVLAGIGHMAFGSGIPERAFRRNNRSYAIILNEENPEQGIADYILYPAELNAPESPKLMVILEKHENGVEISGFSPGSVSEKAGLVKGDIIVSLDETAVEGIDDVRIFLLDKKKNDTITVTVLRKRFLFGPVTKEIQVTL